MSNIHLIIGVAVLIALASTGSMAHHKGGIPDGLALGTARPAGPVLAVNVDKAEKEKTEDRTPQSPGQPDDKDKRTGKPTSPGSEDFPPLPEDDPKEPESKK